MLDQQEKSQSWRVSQQKEEAKKVVWGLEKWSVIAC